MVRIRGLLSTQSTCIRGPFLRPKPSWSQRPTAGGMWSASLKFRAMPNRPASTPLRKVKNNDRQDWPQPSRYGEESYPTPRGHPFMSVAFAFARQLAKGESPVYSKAVAQEALNRFRFDRSPLGLNPRFQGPPNAGDLGEGANDHAEWLFREMAWHRERWSTQTNTFQWRRYSHEPQFVGWLQTVPAVELLQWVRRYLPPAQGEALSEIRRRVSNLVPMPESIRRAFFFATVSKEELSALAGVHQALDPSTERHVALVCHRLLAFHAAKHSRFGPGRVFDLFEMLTRWRRRPRAQGRSIDEALDIAKATCLCMQAGLWEADARVAMGRVQQALHQARDIFEGRQDLKEAVQALSPTTLVLAGPCATCGARELVSPTASALPPFHPSCRCLGLLWQSHRMPELERKAVLWALECGLRRGKPSRFPFEEIVDACERLREVSEVHKSSVIPNRSREALTPRQPFTTRPCEPR